MSSPRRQLLEAVQTCLQAIAIADGFNTDAGANTSLERIRIPDDGNATLGVRIAGQAKATEPAVKKTHRLTTFNVVALVPTDGAGAEDKLDQIVADVERAMANRQAVYPQGVSFPDYLSMTPATPPEGQKGWIGAVIAYQSHIPIQ